MRIAASNEDDGTRGAKSSGPKRTSKLQGLDAAAAEAARAHAGSPANTLGPVTVLEHITYGLENRIAANPNYPFILLIVNSAVVIGAAGVGWHLLAARVSDAEVFGFDSWWDGIYLAANVVMTGGPDTDTPADTYLRYIYAFLVLFGLIVFAIVVGFITAGIEAGLEAVGSGRTKVAESGHTLILGWNEATLRAVVQIAFLRRQYQRGNEWRTFGVLYYFPRLLPLFRVLMIVDPPSTSVAASNIVIMTDQHDKQEMHDMLATVLAERGINPRRTKIGRDIICRVGSPTDVSDLLRVGAHRAAAILVMMSERDQIEEDESEGTIQNGATLRTTLALRNVIFTNPFATRNGRATPHPDLRIVLQMSHPSDYVDAANFTHADGRQVVFPVDLSKFSNSLMFKCAAQPGLSAILLDILDFEGVAIRRRKAKNVRSGPFNTLGACVGQTFGEMRKQFSAAAFIGIVRPGMEEEEALARGFGLCPDMHIKIQREDLLIFVGPRPSPRCSMGMARAFAGYQEEAVKLMKAHPDIEANRAKHGLTNSKRKRALLVCGWRPVWQQYPARLQARLKEITSQRLPGSSIVFVNKVPDEAFAKLMAAVGASKKGPGAYDFAGGVALKHVVGDAAQIDVLKPVIDGNSIDGCVVLGTQANFRLAGIFRDTRVLNVILLLRKLCSEKADAPPMHVVGENTEDLTAKLALAPRRLGGARVVSGERRMEFEPDFVNNMAVNARALVQTLAYPHIESARSELFDDRETSSALINVDAREYVPLQVKMKFGVVRAIVLRAVGERSMCLGVVWGSGAVNLLPKHDTVVRFTDDDRLVLLRRVVKQ